MSNRRIYKHRGVWIYPEPNGKRSMDNHEEQFKTIKEALNFIDKKCGGTATARIPKRLDA